MDAVMSAGTVRSVDPATAPDVADEDFDLQQLQVDAARLRRRALFASLGLMVFALSFAVTWLVAGACGLVPTPAAAAAGGALLIQAGCGAIWASRILAA